MVRRGGGLDAVERLSDDVGGGVEAEAALCPPDVVIHRLRDCHHGGAALRKPRRNGEGVVTTNDNERIESEVLD